jgi:flagellar assembly protein FliH
MIATGTQPDTGVLSAAQAVTLARWQMPVFDAVGATLPEPSLPTAAELEAVEAAAYREGFERGQSEGHAAGLQAIQTQAQRLRALIEQIARPLAQLDDEVEPVLLALAVSIARQLLTEQLSLEPQRIAAMASAALAALPPYVRDVRLHLHPEDAELVGAQLTAPPEAERFRIVPDSTLTRGDCRLYTESAQLDARLDTRLQDLTQRLAGTGT